MTQAFEVTNGREPNLEELAEQVKIPPRKLTALLHIAPETINIDKSTIDGAIATDAKDSYASPDPAEVVNSMLLHRALANHISTLSARDRKEELILRLRFGFGINDVFTLDEIGKRFDVTRERIRQIESKAIRKLQHPARLNSFAQVALGLKTNESPHSRKATEAQVNDEDDTKDRFLPVKSERPETPPSTRFSVQVEVNSPSLPHRQNH